MSHKEFTKAINKIKQLAFTETEDELYRMAQSDIHWVDKRQQKYPSFKISIGNIYQIEFGKNYKPEMSYEHRGLVIGVTEKLIRVLPIYTYNEQKNVSEDIENYKKPLYLLKSCDYDFLKHDSVLKLNEVKIVSIKRILYFQGCIDKNSNLFKSICYRAFRYTFPEYSYALEQANQKIKKLEEKLKNETKKPTK